MIESRSLRLFVLVAQELHFGRAAEKANITLSSLSVQISRLEDVLGCRLLDRNKRAAVALTKAGAIFLPQAEAAVAQLDTAERVGRLAAIGEAGPFRIGYVFSASMCGLLERTLSALRHRYPMLEPHAQLMETPEQLGALASGTLDLGLVRPRPAYPAELVGHSVHAESLLIALSTSHPLASEPAIRARDLAGETFIIPQFQEPFGLIGQLSSLASIGNFPVGNVIETADFVTAVSMASAGYGVALAPRSLGKLKLGQIIYRELQDFSGRVELVALHQRQCSALVAPMIEALTSNC